jgi:hypothetical protein
MPATAWRMAGLGAAGLTDPQIAVRLTVARKTGRPPRAGGALTVLGPDPFLLTIGESLVFPDRDFMLNVVDDCAAGGERIGPARAGDSHDDRNVPDPESTNPVNC